MDEMAGRTKWSFDFIPDDIPAMAKDLVARKINKTLKDKGDGKFITLARNGIKTDGSKMPNIIVVDADGALWDQDVKIGNGTKVTVKYHLNESKYGNLFWVEAVKVDEHVPYEGGEFFPGIPFPEDRVAEGWGDDEGEAPAKPAKARPRAVLEDGELDDEVIL
jgi:hypothetical protein